MNITKYIAVMKNMNDQVNYIYSDAFDTCFSYIQKFIKYPYKQAYIMSLDSEKIILSMREWP